ncbi:F-box/kelch-repeat protein At3g23880-like [Prunus avium]|uniref:F-box/kelch-repeat protein At3g23880-like n=1 Tax=Prunus avium TaxID=42229 RepID=A0A6P5SKG8_PRUAV|nr:F-box/kelch-repeat protein At3g23880-like [Prunus avium]
MANICKIGEDLLEKVLSSLPPKTLMRFKCVAKWWYALINNPRFVDNQLFNCLHNNQSICIFLKRLVPHEDPNANETKPVFSMLTFCEYDGDGDGEHIYRLVLSRVEDINVPLCMSKEELSVVGHCHGIICVATFADYGKVFLWNPAIQEFKLLPSQKYLPDMMSLLEQGIPYTPNSSRLRSGMGFGYDPISKAYKVVNIMFSWSQTHAHTNYSVVIYPLRAEVYTLGTSEDSSCWREIKSYSLETETTFLWPESFQIYLKGMCYWLGIEKQKEFMDDEEALHDQNEIRQVIVSFDMSGEVFDELVLPDELLEASNCYIFPGLYMYLIVWNESSISLCGLRNNSNGIRCFGMWLMLMEDGFGDCVWTKYVDFELTVSLSPMLMGLRACSWALAFSKSDHLLVVEFNGCTVCYNIRTKNRMSLPTIQTATGYYDPLENPVCGREYNGPVVYANSIVSV